MKIRTVTLLLIQLLVFYCACGAEIFGIPHKGDLLIERKGLIIGYSHTYRQAIWTAYILSADNLQSKQVKRQNRFLVDPMVKWNPVHPRDYSKTGYDKGHLAPAADMTYSVETMKNSFFMSNITPQTPGCNRGIWKRIEHTVREWTLREQNLCIVTGPIFKKSYKKMGKGEIPVPHAFYKVVFDMTPPHKMIGFIVPNEASKKHISKFVVSVNEVERITGLDFFSDLEDALEKELERTSDIQAWK